LSQQKIKNFDPEKKCDPRKNLTQEKIWPNKTIWPKKKNALTFSPIFILTATKLLFNWRCARKFVLRSRTAPRGNQQGCQIFLGAKYQNGAKYTETGDNMPNGHKYTKWP
jgi:hypothetical protein